MPDDDELYYDVPAFWVRQSAGDIVIARLRQEGVLFEHRLFHAQQAVEKALKGVLVARGLLYPRTHNIRELIDNLRAGGVEVPEEADDAKSFTDFESLTRYPIDFAAVKVQISEELCEVAAETADAVLEWAKQEIARAEAEKNQDSD